MEEATKIYNNYPTFYQYPYTTLTSVTNDYIELHCEKYYEPTAIIRININDDTVETENFVENKKQWRDDMYEKLNKLNMVHCQCCPNHGWDRSVILLSQSLELFIDTPFSDCYNNFDDPKFDNILSDEAYASYFRRYNRLYYYYFDNYRLDIWFDKLYIISDENCNIINILYAPDYRLQMGDNGTKVRFINEKMIVIENNGDVWSVVVIKL